MNQNSKDIFSKSEWKEYSIGDLASMKYGKKIPDEYKTNKGYPVFNGYGVTGSSSEYLYEDPKVVVVARGVGGTGDVKLSPKKSWITNLSIVLELDEKKVDKRFLKYSLDEQDLKSKLNTGSAQAQITISSLKPFKIKLPPVSYQEKVVSRLSTFDDLIANNKRRIEILEEMAETIYREWFVNFNFPGSEDVEMKDSELGIIPETFEVCEFQKELKIQNGYAFKSETYSENGMPIIRTKDFSSTKFIDREEDVRVPYELAKEKSKYRSKELDFLLIMVGASIGNYGIAMEKDLPALQNQNMWAIRPKDDSYFSKYFVIHHMPRLVKRQKSFARGAAREYFRKGDFSSASITKPPKELIQLFDKKVVPIVGLMNNLLQRNENLRQIRDLLLPRLISGEVKPV